MVGGKVDGQILFGARSEKPKNSFGAKWQLRKILFGSQRVKVQYRVDSTPIGRIYLILFSSPIDLLILLETSLNLVDNILVITVSSIVRKFHPCLFPLPWYHLNNFWTIRCKAFYAIIIQLIYQNGMIDTIECLGQVNEHAYGGALSSASDIRSKVSKRAI